jgi:hypothetical protein
MCCNRALGGMFNRIISPSQDFMQHKNPNGSAQSTNAKANLISARFRGYAKGPGGGLGAAPLAGETIDFVGYPEITALEISAEFCST